MRSVFVKEWRQGHMIALFGLLMGGLITALWGIFTVAYVRNWIDQENVNGFCGVMFYLVPLALAVFVGAGLFAAEVERGTMPLLLALPFSRRQVWLGKVAAGLALMLSAAVMAIVPGTIATRPALEEVGFWQFLPELALASALFYFGALFWSTVLATIASAFLSAIASAIGLAIVAVSLMVFGGRLFGPPLVDIEVWALTAIPGLVAGSYLGFVRGEAFLGKRRWAGPLVTALAVYLVSMVALCGMARRMTRYDRSQVYKVGAAAVTANGSAVSALTYASPVELTREADTRLYGRPNAGDRRVYSVAVDLDTKKELLTRREAGAIAVSPDGKYAAVLTGPRPLTWRGESSGNGGPIIEIWHLSRKRMTYRGVPARVSNGGLGSLEWSPDGKWVALVSPESTGVKIVFLGTNGMVRRTVTALGWYGFGSAAWAFARSGGVVYAMGGDGAVTRYDIASGTSGVVWTTTAAGLDPERWVLTMGRLAVSPDGRRVAVAVTAYERPESYRAPIALGPGRRSALGRSIIAVFESETRQARVVASSEEPAGDQAGLAWSGSTLYCVSVLGEDWQSSRTQVAVWRVGQTQARIAPLPVRGPVETALLPGNRLLVARRWIIDSDARVTPTTGAVEDALAGSSVAGMDSQGRLIVTRWEGEEKSYLAALNVDTGQVTRIYP
jgi:hypothetical protein